MDDRKLRILFVGESWLGSCARSMREALARQPDLRMDDLNADVYSPPYRSYCLRGANRLLARYRRQEFAQAVLARIATWKPDYLVTYKGSQFDATLLHCIRALNVKTVNIYPDCSPHAHGTVHRDAVGLYDMVVSTKPFHPAVWHATYGYSNPCEFVPQGYDPMLHLESEPPGRCNFDVAMVATWRQEYHELMVRFAAASRGNGLKVAIAGHGWQDHHAAFPENWTFGGAIHGRMYVDWLRNARVCLAPITTDVVIGGRRQPGDVDSTRTYELAAAYCFFIHRRSAYAESLYDEATEVPLFDTPKELAEKTLYYLGQDDLRAEMAARAHRRAVPAYSNDQRARAIVDILRSGVR